MSDICEYYSKIIPLNYIIRYSNVPRIKDETVASHSFLVAAILFKLHEEYDFCLGHALKLAICHDMPEYEVNDITHATKKKYPKIAEALQEAEIAAINEMPNEVIDAYYEFEEGKTKEARFVIYADVIQCSQYAENEVALGNKGYMAQIVMNSYKRRDAIRKDLEKYRR